jgi:hypothetical protein
MGDVEGRYAWFMGLRLHANTDLLDAFVCVSTPDSSSDRGGRLHNVRWSPRLRPDIDDIRCGPMSVDIIVGLRTMRVRCDSNEHGQACDLLWEGVCSLDADAPEAFLHPDAVLYDIVGDEHTRWSAIRAFFANGIVVWPDLVLAPEQFWTSDGGVSLSWVMSATITEAVTARFGADDVGRQWRSEGMTWLRIDSGRVRREVDYHDSGAIARSLSA